MAFLSLPSPPQANRYPPFDLHLTELFVHPVGRFQHNARPFLRRLDVPGAGDQIWAPLQLPMAEGSGEGLDDPQRQGKGREIEEIIRVVGHQAADVLHGKALGIAPESQHLRRRIAAQVAAPSAVGGEIAQQEFPQRTAQRNPDLPAQQPQRHPDGNAHRPDEHWQLAPQMGAVGHILNQPPGNRAEGAQNDGKQNLDCPGGGHIHSHAHAAENLRAAAKSPENLHVSADALVHIPLVGDDGGNLAAELGVGIAGGVHRLAAAEKEGENLVFKETALVAHIHALAQQHLASVRLDEQVAQLRPGKHHHGQIAAGQCQAAPQLARGNALRRGRAAAVGDGLRAQENQPVHQRKAHADQHVSDLRVALPDVGADGWEHFLIHQHGHGDAFVVVQDGLAGADDLVAAHRDGQVGGDALLTVDAGEFGRVGHIPRGHGDDKAELFHREFKAAEQIDAQL